VLALLLYAVLQGLVLPPAVASDVELASLMLRACPFTDLDELLPICYRCQATNTLLNTQVWKDGLVQGHSCMYAVHI
jgi:intraflagellar transport protein 122